MKLHRMRIGQFRKFAAPVQIGDLEAGLNILYGPNEAGKSTIAQALRTLFLEKHSTKGNDFVAAISPAGTNGAAPCIEADFTLGLEECAASKTYLQKARAKLTIGNTSWDGNEADEQLAQRLGFGLAGKGASRPEIQGIPGLLWIAQGASAELADPVGHATKTLEDRLKSILGEITSTSGNRLAGALQTELGKLMTAGGRPSGVLASAEKSQASAALHLDSLQAQADEFRSVSDRLARSILGHDQMERERPWEGYERQRRDAEDQKAALEPQQQALEAKRQSLRETKARTDGLHEQRMAREKELKALAKQRQLLANSIVAHEGSLGSLKLAEQRKAEAREQRNDARARHQAAEQRQLRGALETEIKHIRGEIKRAEDILDRAGHFADSLAGLRVRASATKVSKADLGKLEKLERELRENRIQQEAIATRIAYRLEPGQRVEALGFGMLEGSGNQHITAPLTLRIAGIGELEIAPGGEDIARLSDEAHAVRNRIATLCANLGVADLADAQTRHGNFQEMERDIALQEKERDTLLAGNNEVEWRAALADAQGRGSDREQRLASLPASEQGISIEEARRALEDAEAESNDAEQRQDVLQRATTEAQFARERLQVDVDSTELRLESAAASESADQRDREFAEAVVRHDALELEIGQAEALLAERKPELIEADIQRYSQALALVEKDRRRLRESIAEARASLETLGVGGLDEKLAAAGVASEHQAKRLAQYRLRAQALSLLDSRLSAHQEAATQRLYAPLRDRLKHYLEILFPGTQIGIGVDELRPTALGRGGAELALEDHSHGTREQLGVIARFAYADLLKEAGQPTLLILDDALVHSDSDRRQQMKRILHDAAQRHQILLFTCHPEDWRDAGARMMFDVAGIT